MHGVLVDTELGDPFSFAWTIYLYWKERCIERGTHRVIPILNVSLNSKVDESSLTDTYPGDESDMLNKSYIHLRRCEIQAVRETRASQATLSDKLVRLQAVLARETIKNDYAQQGQQVWETRLVFIDHKWSFVPM